MEEDQKTNLELKEEAERAGGWTDRTDLLQEALSLAPRQDIGSGTTVRSVHSSGCTMGS